MLTRLIIATVSFKMRLIERFPALLDLPAETELPAWRASQVPKESEERGEIRERLGNEEK